MGLTDIWIIHNHPSGDPTPSDEDLALTRDTGRNVPGSQGHVIIDSNKYAVIHPGGHGEVLSAQFHNGPDPLLTPSLPHPVLGRVVTKPIHVAKLAHEFGNRSGWSTMVAMGVGGKVRSLVEVPYETLLDHTPRGQLKLQALVRRIVHQTGAHTVYAVLPPASLMRPNLSAYGPWIEALKSNDFLDFVDETGGSLRKRLEDYGVIPEKKTKLLMGKEARVRRAP